MLSSCASFEQKLGIDDHLTCTPHDAVGCIGFYNNPKDYKHANN